MQKHAYLILAHNEYEVLQELVSALDYSDNDIYIHIDRKSDKLPVLSALNSKLKILSHRIDVNWGCVSIVMAESALLKEAYNSGVKYEYYHLISGIHYPIKSHSEMRLFFKSAQGKCIIQPLEDSFSTMGKRLGKYHLFLQYYNSQNRFLWRIYRLFWRSCVRFQYLIGINRNTSFYGGKSSNWCSLNSVAVQKWISDIKKIKKRFKLTYCSDEYVPLSIIKEYNIPFIESDKILYQEFECGNPRIFNENDFDLLVKSGALFGRKFTKDSLELIKKLKDEIHKDLYN